MSENPQADARLISIAQFIANKLHDDIAEGGENVLNLTNIHHSDHAPNVVSIELMNGEIYTIMVNQGWVA